MRLRSNSGGWNGQCSLHATFPSSSRRDAGKVARGVPRTRGDPWKAKHKVFAPRQGRGGPGRPAPIHGSNTKIRSNCAAVPRTSAEVRILYNIIGSRGARSTAPPGYLPGVPPGRPSSASSFVPPLSPCFLTTAASPMAGQSLANDTGTNTPIRARIGDKTLGSSGLGVRSSPPQRTSIHCHGGGASLIQ